MRKNPLVWHCTLYRLGGCKNSAARGKHNRTTLEPKHFIVAIFTDEIIILATKFKADIFI
jgi:hypothetical protein